MPPTLQTLKVPGKVILSGEYAVLFGGTGIVVAVNHRGPGFGSSVAEWLERSFARNQELSPDLVKNLWKQYRLDHGTESLLPSGADLVAQILGGCVLFREKSWKKIELPRSLLDRSIIVQPKNFEKEKTYLNLRSETVLNFVRSPEHENDRRLWIEAGEDLAQAIEYDEDVAPFIEEWNRLAIVFGLATHSSLETCAKLMKLPHIDFVKGCGAGFHDVFWVGFPTKEVALKNFETLKTDFNIIGFLDELYTGEGAHFG